MKRIAVVLGVVAAMGVTPSIAAGANVVQVAEPQLVRSLVVESQLARSQVVPQRVTSQLAKAQRVTAQRASSQRAQVRRTSTLIRALAR